jgi:hypothetical protein
MRNQEPISERVEREVQKYKQRFRWTMYGVSILVTVLLIGIGALAFDGDPEVTLAMMILSGMLNFMFFTFAVVADTSAFDRSFRSQILMRNFSAEMLEMMEAQQEKAKRSEESSRLEEEIIEDGEGYALGDDGELIRQRKK